MEYTPTYKIVRHRFSGRSKVIRKGLTLEEAQSWCRREDTHGGTGDRRWFDGYTLDGGCRFVAGPYPVVKEVPA